MEKKNKKKSIKGLVIFMIVIVLLVIFISLTRFITDWEWFKEVGYESVFFKELLTKVEIGVPIFLILLILSLLYLLRLKKSYFKKIASKEITNQKRLSKINWILSIVYSLIMAVTFTNKLWFQYLQSSNSTSFDLTDPIFNLDVSFYIFKLDFLDELNEILIFGIIALVILTIIYYLVLLTVRTPDVFKDKPQYEGEETKASFDPNDPLGSLKNKFENKLNNNRKEFDKDNVKGLLGIASGKLSALGFIFFIMLAIDFILQEFTLLQAHNGVVYGAGYTDVKVTLVKLQVLSILSIGAAIFFVVSMLRKKYKRLLLIPISLVLVFLVGSGAEMLVQNFIVSPDELNKESEYLERNITYTQYAYGIENVTVKEFAADNTLTKEDITSNTETIDNIRINDFEPAQQFYNQTQSIRQYYTFYDVDNDRYTINGEYTQTFLTAREIDETKISDTWLNQHLKYTHGYGAAMSRVDEVTSSGQPDVLVGNIPAESKAEEISITQPEIYFGELSNNYIIVGTKEDEFDYPNGSENSYTRYSGTAGIKLNFINRILFTIREGDLQILTSSLIDSDSRIIINREITERVYKIMPYLSYEGDPYLVVDSDGKLWWMMDCYTKSSNFPYSEPYSGTTNYIRNSIKVTVDCYNGDVSFYIIDETDPIALTYQKIFPSLFKNMSEMPESLVDHIRYPNELFEIQANVYAKYHMSNIAVFYQSEDLWEIGYEIYETSRVKIEPNYYIAKLPGEDEAEFFNSVPYTPKSKQNMTALLIARNDGENYGELILYQFPKSRTIYGTEQIEAQIDQNTEISKEFSLWTSAGTSYRRGNLFVIPIGTSILYVEPVYLEAQNSSIPEVKRIIVAYNDEIAYGETLDECLEQIFGVIDRKSTKEETKEEESDVTELTTDELIDKAVTAYNNAISAQKEGDWALYGEYIEELQKILKELDK